MNYAFYDFSKFAVRTLARAWRARIFGARNVPVDGPLIVACNHVSYLDPPILGACCPRRIRYMAKKELFRIPLLGPVIRGLGAYSVDREGSATAAIKRSLQVLESGGVVGIFPQGRRSPGGTAPPQMGVALLASLAQVPVVPARVRGTDRALALAQIDVSFGTPRELPGGRKATRDDLAKFADEIMIAIDRLPECISGNS
jgi:1-acyl-sn-glycerol-3-phosphate acyltransferase